MSTFTRTDCSNTAFPVFVLTVCAIFSSHVDANLLDPSQIMRELQTFANDALGVDKLQVYFNRLQYDKQKLDGNTITSGFAVKLKDKFKIRFGVTERLKRAVEASYASPPNHTTVKECCKVDKSTLVYDKRFRSKVDLNNICLKISGSVSPNPTYLDNDAVLKEMKDTIKKYPFLKWQYFGSEEGVMTIFPVYDDKDACPKYDPRFRPYYVETATPEAKDVVLVIDTSASMLTDKRTLAIESAKTVLDTMNPKDKIGVVSFNDVASTNGGSQCYGERLALAVPTNKNSLKRYVDGLTGHGNSIYQKGFVKACALLKASASEEPNKNKKRVILFLTDGEPSDRNVSLIFKTIRDCNLELNNSVIIFTYGIGTVNKEILIDIAIQNTTKYGFPPDKSLGDITSGKYAHVAIEDLNTLRSKMATYYNFLPPVRLDRPVVSVPYIDAAGLGLLVSITLPCYDRTGKFIGVVGTDMNIDELLSDITFFNQGQTTYAFMISGSGRTIIHPLLPAPSHAYADPIFMDIRTLEPDSEFKEVFDSMTTGGTGSKTFVATRFLPRGGEMSEGVTVKQLESTYFWSPVERTEFSIGVVIPVSYESEVLHTLQIPEGYSFKYHRIDLDPPASPCLHFGKVVCNDTTVVKFAPWAFKDPFAYIGQSETKVEMQLLDKYMMRTPGSEYAKLRPDIRNTVIATWKVDQLWLREKTELTQYLVWRYIGTANGVFRKTPGTVIPKSFDPRTRPWYYTALSHSGLITLTTPYLDLGGAGVVITVARTLYRDESSDNVLGVMGADFPLRYFYRLLSKVYPRCTEKGNACFVMDHAGFLIMHEDFMRSSATGKDLAHVHITQKERHIAEDLINKGFLIKKECRNLEEIKKQSFYEVNSTMSGVQELTRSGCKYELARITGTNVFLGVAVRDSFCSSDSCTCASDNECSVSKPVCECPCTSSMQFQHCRFQFPNSSLPICPAIVPTGQPDDFKPMKKACLKKCFDLRCEERNSLQLCDGIVSCYWCQKNEYGIPLDKAYCASSERCFRGKESPAKQSDADGVECSPSTSRPISKNAGLSTGAKVGIAIGCVLLLLAIILVFLGAMIYYRNSADPPKNRERKDSTKQADASPSLSSPANHNPAFLYEEIDAMKPPETHANIQNQWRPLFIDIEAHNTGIIDPEVNAALPAYPGRTRRSSSSPPPPVPNTRQSTCVGAGMRSQTDVNPTPPLPPKRRPSDAPDPHFTPSFNPNSRMPSDGTATSNSSNPIGITNQRRQSADGVGRDISPNLPQLIQLVPRTRIPSEGNLCEIISDVPPPDGISGQQTTIYSNFLTSPISEAGEGPNGDNGDNDDMDDDGSIQ